jgi:hypothetical protein
METSHNQSASQSLSIMKYTMYPKIYNFYMKYPKVRVS